jgi:hypothetical protein
MSRPAPQTAVLWRARNWDAVSPKIRWDRSRRRPSRSLNQLCHKQKITAARKQKEIEALAANLKEQASQIRKLNAQFATASPSRGGFGTSKQACAEDGAE